MTPPASIPSPAEIAEANRAKDEEWRAAEIRQSLAKDDELLATWIPAAVAGLIHVYRGSDACSFPIPDVVSDPGRFAGKAGEAFAGTGWDVRRIPKGVAMWNDLIRFSPGG